MVLIGSDGHEARLGEGKGAEVPVCVRVAVGSRIHVHNVEARLIPMHGVQYHLHNRRSKHRHLYQRNVLRSERVATEAITDMSVVIQQVVGEFQFIKRDDLLHPLRAFGRRVRVVVDPARRGGVRLTGDQPRRAVEGIPDRKEGSLGEEKKKRFELSDFIFNNKSHLTHRRAKRRKDATITYDRVQRQRNSYPRISAVDMPTVNY